MGPTPPSRDRRREHTQYSTVINPESATQSAKLGSWQLQIATEQSVHVPNTVLSVTVNDQPSLKATVALRGHCRTVPATPLATSGRPSALAAVRPAGGFKPPSAGTSYRRACASVGNKPIALDLYQTASHVEGARRPRTSMRSSCDLDEDVVGC